MHIGCIKVVALFYSHLVADIATTRPRNFIIDKFLLNSMIEEYQSKSWTDLLEGTFCHMTQRRSDKRQEYITERGDDIVPKVQAILLD